MALNQTSTLAPIRSFALAIAVSQVVGHPDGQHLFLVEHVGNRAVKVALGDGRLAASYEFPYSIGRIVLTPDLIVRTGHIGAATAEAGEPAHAGIPARHSVWWSWRPPGPGRITLSTEGSDFDTVLAVYRN